MIDRSIYVLRIAGVALIYAFLAKIALTYFSPNGVASLIWPSSGFALAVLLIGGKKYWPAILIGAFIANLFVGRHIPEAAVITIGSTLAALIGFWLLTRSHRFNIKLVEPRDFLLLGLAGAISALVASAIGITAISQADTINFLHWWQGDMLGIVVVTPLILVWRNFPQGWFSRNRIIETITCFGLAYLTGQIIFLGWFHEYLSQIRGFWMFVFVTWAAVRFGRHGALLVIVITATQSLIGTIQNTGLFSNDLIQGGLLNFWFYILTLSIVGITLALAFERERNSSKKALEKNEERLRIATASGQVAVWEVDLINNKLIWDDTCFNLYKINKEDFGGTFEEWAARIHPEDLDRTVAAFRKAAADQGEYKPKFRIIWPNGEIRHIEGHGKLIKDESGKPLSMIGTNWDITEAKQTEAALKASEERFKIATASDQIGIWELNLLNNEVIWDDTMFSLYGISKEDFPNAYEAWVTCVHPEDRDRIKKEILSAIKGKSDYHPQFRIIRPNGELRHIEGHAIVVKDKFGKAVRMIGTNWNNAAHVSTQEQLTLAKAAIDLSQTAFYKLSIEGKVIYANEAACKSLGYSKGELTGKYVWEFDPDFSAEDWKPMWEGLRKNKTVHIETRHQHKDGTIFPVEVVGNLIRTNDEEFSFTFIQDISERKNVEAQQAKINQRLLFFNELNEAIRILAEPNEIIATVTRMLGQHLNVSRCAYAELESDGEHVVILGEYLDNCPSILGKHPFSIFSGLTVDTLKAGKTLIIANVDEQVPIDDGREAFNAMNIKAVMAYPLIKNDKLQAIMGLQQTTARQWGKDEVVLVQEVAERSWAVIERARSEIERRKLANIIDGSMSEMIMFDAKTLRITYANKGAQKNLGYTIEQLLTMTPRDIKPDFEEKSFRHMLAPLLRHKQKQLIIESLHRRANGTTFPVEVRLQLAEPYDSGQIFAFINDITERKEADAAILASADSLARAQAIAEVGDWELNITTLVVTKWSAQMYHIVGLKLSDKLPTFEEFLKMVHPDDLAYIKNSFKQEVSEKHGGVHQFRIIRKDGSMIWVEGCSEIVLDKRGQAVSMIGTLQNITSRKKAEERIHRLSQLYRALSETNQAIVRMEQQSELFPLVCKCAVEFGGMKLAWIGKLEAATKKIIPVASFGDEDGYLNSITISARDKVKDGRGPVGMAFRENKPIIINDFLTNPRTAFWHEQAAKHGWSSVAAFPIQRNGKPFAVLAVYHTDSAAFDKETIRLVEEMASDITFALDNFDREVKRKEAEESLRLAASVYENSSEAMTVTDADGVILTVNPAFTRVTGYLPEDVIGKNTSLLSSDRHDEAFYKEMWNEIKTTGQWKGEIWDKRKNGEIYPAWLTINTLYNEDGTPYRYISLFSDSTAWKETEALIWHQANFDPLTQLPNRQMFHDRLDQEIKKAHRANRPLALLFIDLDRFKEINDTLGHDMGDVLLKEAAQRLCSCVREADTVARLGGDEFTVILSDLEDLNSVERVTLQILNKLTKPFKLNGELGYVTASVGITMYPEDATNIDDLLKNADQAMYEAKSLGRNRYSYYTLSLQESAQLQMQIANDLRNALAKKQLWVAYQPIISLSDGKILKAEALVRWKHPKLGEISPSEFIPVAEHTGLIIDIGDWVFRQAAQQVKLWQEFYKKEFQISVNKSPVQINDKSKRFIPWFKQLKKLKLSGKSIVIEITEGLLMEANIHTKEKLLEYRDAGIQVALDDFGTGYSSLSYIKEFDIDYIKIDQVFIRGLKSDSEQLALCEAIIVMAHKLNIEVIAEGVETKQQRDLLIKIGCDYAQGYFFSHPVSAKEFEKLFKA